MEMTVVVRGKMEVVLKMMTVITKGMKMLQAISICGASTL